MRNYPYFYMPRYDETPTTPAPVTIANLFGNTPPATPPAAPVAPVATPPATPTPPVAPPAPPVAPPAPPAAPAALDIGALLAQQLQQPTQAFAIPTERLQQQVAALRYTTPAQDTELVTQFGQDQGQAMSAILNSTMAQQMTDVTNLVTTLVQGLATHLDTQTQQATTHAEIDQHITNAFADAPNPALQNVARQLTLGMVQTYPNIASSELATNVANMLKSSVSSAAQLQTDNLQLPAGGGLTRDAIMNIFGG